MKEHIEPDELIGPVDPRTVRAILATTLNGSAVTPEGTSGALGNRTDTALLLRVREIVDVILVGAGTVRTEGYGPAHSGTPIAVVSRSLDFDTSTSFFADGEPIVLAPQDSLEDPVLTERRRRLTDAGARLLSIGDGSPAAMLAALRSQGLTHVGLEGGPRLYEEFLRAGLVDVWHVTVDPSIVTPVATPFIAGAGKAESMTRHRLHLENASATADGCLFLRYRRA